MIKNEIMCIKPASEEQRTLLGVHPEAAPICAGGCTLYAVENTDGTLVGAVAQRRYEEWSMPGLLCFTLPEYRRRGYAWQAVHEFTRWFYGNGSENMLAAVVELENVPAVRTLERAGFEYIRTTTLEGEDGKGIYHLFLCSRASAEAGAPPRGCCCGCGGK